MKLKLVLTFTLFAKLILAQWTNINNSPANGNAIYFYNASIGYVLKQNQIYKTTDGGTSWNSIPNNFTSYTRITEIYFTTPDLGFIVTTDGMTFAYPKTVYKTIDGGLTWNELLGPFNGSSIAFKIENNQKWVFNVSSNWLNGPTDTIYSTNDAGTSWNKIGNATTAQYNQLINNLIIYGDSSNNNKQYVTKSMDGGATWNILLVDSTPDAGFIDHKFIDANNGFALLYQYNPSDTLRSKVYTTIDGGQNWITHQLPKLCENPASLHFTDKDNGYVVAGYDTIFKTIDGGANWNVDFSTQVGSYFVDSRVFNYFGTLYVLGNNEVIKKKIITSVFQLPNKINNYKLFPNPCNDILTIEGNIDYANDMLVITDVTGREIANFTAEQKSKQVLDVSFLEIGVYMLRNTAGTSSAIFMKK